MSEDRRLDAAKLYFGTEPAWLEAISDWASQKQQIMTLWLHGSRVTGRRRIKPDPPPVPDLDIAFALDVAEYSVLLGEAISLAPRWRAELSALLPVEVDIQYADPDDRSRAAFIRRIYRNGVVIYRRASP